MRATTPTSPVSLTIAPSPPTTPAASRPSKASTTAPQHGEPNEDVIAAAIDEIQRGDRVHRQKGDRSCGTGPPPHDDARRHQCCCGKSLVEEPGRQLRRAKHGRRRARDRGEEWPVHRGRVPPGMTNQLEERVLRKIGGDVRVWARVIHGEDAAVDRIPPEIVARTRRRDDCDRGLQDGRARHELDRQTGPSALGDDHRHVAAARDQDQEYVQLVRQRAPQPDDCARRHGGRQQCAGRDSSTTARAPPLHRVRVVHWR